LLESGKKLTVRASATRVSLLNLVLNLVDLPMDLPLEYGLNLEQPRKGLRRPNIPHPLRLASSVKACARMETRPTSLY
jgi:hypothetical protein